MRYYIIAGERSGDLHAANLIRSLRKEDQGAEIRCLGGDMMKEAGAELFLHYKEISYMGFLEVVMNAFEILKVLSSCKKDIVRFQPDVLILVDFAGFNLRIAKYAKKKGLRVFYYISPKVWAWNQKRALKIKERVDRMFVILPFEKDFYKKYDFDVDFVGNPVCDEVVAHKADPDFRKKNLIPSSFVIAVLPGSREQEVQEMLHYMVSILPVFPDHHFVVAAVSNLPKAYYENFRRENKVSIVYDQTYDLLVNSEAAIVTSGTATLETALFEVPQLVCYKTSDITYLIAKNLIKVKYISLVNLIAGREVVKELIQDNFTPYNLVAELKKILFNKDFREQQIKDYKEIKLLLGGEGASEKAASLMVKALK